MKERLAALTSERRRWPEAGVARVTVGVAVLVTLVQEGPRLLALSDPGSLHMGWTVGLPHLPVEAAWGLLIASGLLAAAFLVGFRARWSGALLSLALTAILLADRQLYSNHLYLLVLEVGLLALAGAGRARGLDGRRQGNEEVMVWPLLLLMAQVSMVYLFAGLAKLNPEFLSGAVLASLLGASLGGLEALEGWAPPLAAAAVLVAVVEAGLAAALWSRRLRRIAAVAGGLMHLCMMALVLDLGIVAFTLATVGVYPLFLSRDRAEAGRPPGPPGEP